MKAALCCDKRDRTYVWCGLTVYAREFWSVNRMYFDEITWRIERSKMNNPECIRKNRLQRYERLGSSKILCEIPLFWKWHQIPSKMRRYDELLWNCDHSERTCRNWLLIKKEKTNEWDSKRGSDTLADIFDAGSHVSSLAEYPIQRTLYIVIPLLVVSSTIRST